MLSGGGVGGGVKPALHVRLAWYRIVISIRAIQLSFHFSRPKHKPFVCLLGWERQAGLEELPGLVRRQVWRTMSANGSSTRRRANLSVSRCHSILTYSPSLPSSPSFLLLSIFASFAQSSLRMPPPQSLLGPTCPAVKISWPAGRLWLSCIGIIISIFSCSHWSNSSVLEVCSH